MNIPNRQNGLQIRILTSDDVTEVSKIHFAAFRNSALTRLGHEAVRRYYEWQMIGPHEAVNLGGFSNEHMIGVCFGGVFHGAMGGFLRKNRTFLILHVLTRPWLITNPLFRERLGDAIDILYKRAKVRTPKGEPTPITRSPERRFGILCIAVSPQYQGSGVAQQLMTLAEQIALERGFDHLGLTVHPTNARAIRFYEKMGWQRVQTDGMWTGSMV